MLCCFISSSIRTVLKCSTHRSVWFVFISSSLPLTLLCWFFLCPDNIFGMVYRSFLLSCSDVFFQMYLCLSLPLPFVNFSLFYLSIIATILLITCLFYFAPCVFNLFLFSLWLHICCSCCFLYAALVSQPLSLVGIHFPDSVVSHPIARTSVSFHLPLLAVVLQVQVWCLFWRGNYHFCVWYRCTLVIS